MHKLPNAIIYPFGVVLVIGNNPKMAADVSIIEMSNLEE